MRAEALPTEYQRFPSHWRILPFSEAFEDKTGGQTKIQKGDYLNDGLLPIVDQGQSLFGGFTNDHNFVCKIELPCILFGDHTKNFKFIEKPFALGADGVKVLKQRSDIDPKFAFRYLNTLSLPDVGYSRHFRFLKRTFFPLPPLEEQRRIAAILDKADAVRRERQEAIALTEELLRSAFLEMFGDPITNPKGWQTKRLGDLAQFVGGGTPSRQKSEYYQGGICWATPKDMGVDVLTDTEEHITPEAIEQSATKLVGIGSLLVVVKSKVLGRRLPIVRTIVPTCFGQDLKAVIPHEAAIARYLHRHIKYGEQTLLQLARGINTEGLTLEHLRNYQVMISPASEVARFVQLDIVLENARNKQKAFLDKSTNLFNSLLQRAFRGEL